MSSVFAVKSAQMTHSDCDLPLIYTIPKVHSIGFLFVCLFVLLVSFLILFFNFIYLFIYFVCVRVSLSIFMAALEFAL